MPGGGNSGGSPFGGMGGIGSILGGGGGPSPFMPGQGMMRPQQSMPMNPGMPPVGQMPMQRPGGGMPMSNVPPIPSMVPKAGMGGPGGIGGVGMSTPLRNPSVIPSAGGPSTSPIMGEMPEMVHKYLATPQGESLIQGMTPDLKTKIEPVAKTSPIQASQDFVSNRQQQPTQISQAPTNSIGNSNLGTTNLNNGQKQNNFANLPLIGPLLGPIGALLSGGMGNLGGNPQNRTQGLLGGSIANPAITPPAQSLNTPNTATNGNLGANSYTNSNTTGLNLNQPVQSLQNAISPLVPKPVQNALAPVTKGLQTTQNAVLGAGNKVMNTATDIGNKVVDTAKTVASEALGGRPAYAAGDLAGLYETSKFGGDPGFISKGASWGDPGGTSYGAYQLESNKGTLQGYLKTNDMYAQQLRGLTPNSAGFKQKWKEIAKADPEGFKQSQFNYLASKPGGYNDAMAYGKKLGLDTDNPAVQSAIFSISNQSGGWKHGIFDKAGINANDSVESQINKLYDARANYFKGLSSLSPKLKSNLIQNRTVDERNKVLSMIGT